MLLLGSVLVVYAGILASQEVGSHSSHLPLWGILGSIGAVIVGAGIYSTFLEPEAPGAPGASSDWVTVPKAEWQARSKASRPAVRSSSPTEAPPIWWEGPGLPPRAAPVKTSTVESTTRPTRLSPTPARPSPPAGRPTRSARPAPQPTARYSFRELSDELSELEALVYGGSGSSLGKPPRTPARPSDSAASVCMDCGRPLTTAASASPCQGCGQGLCARCAASSRSEDGEVRCVDCRAGAT